MPFFSPTVAPQFSSPSFVRRLMHACFLVTVYTTQTLLISLLRFVDKNIILVEVLPSAHLSSEASFFVLIVSLIRGSYGFR